MSMARPLRSSRPLRPLPPLLPRLLADDEWCATLEMKFNYHVRVDEGRLTCEAAVLHRGKRIANIEARLYQNGRLVSSANGNFAIFAAPVAA